MIIFFKNESINQQLSSTAFPHILCKIIERKVNIFKYCSGFGRKGKWVKSCAEHSRSYLYRVKSEYPNAFIDFK